VLDFPLTKLLQRGSRTPEELLSGATFPCRYSEAAPAEFGIRRGLHPDDIKIKNKDPEYFKRRFYAMKLSAGLPNLVSRDVNYQSINRLVLVSLFCNI
jgi:hypothetical protein